VRDLYPSACVRSRDATTGVGARVGRGSAEVKVRDGVRARGVRDVGDDARGDVFFFFVVGTGRRARGGRRFEDENVGDGAWGFLWCAST